MIITYLCFRPDSVTAPDLASLLRLDLGFRPVRLRMESAGRVSDAPMSKRSVDRMASLSDLRSAEILGEDGSLGLSGIARGPADLLVMKTAGWPNEELIMTGAAWPGFCSALVGDADDVFWQSEHQIGTYELFDRSWRHLPLTYDDTFGEDVIDISGNPGRQSPVPGMWLWAASRMWFGAGAFLLLDRDKLLNLPVGTVVELDDELIRVDLYGLDEDLEAIRDAQRRFRDWMGYDDLERRAPQLAEELQDPTIEMEQGAFPHGGVRRFTQWFDDGRSVPRSRATSKRVVELGPDGERTWEEDAQV